MFYDIFAPFHLYNYFNAVFGKLKNIGERAEGTPEKTSTSY